MAIAPKRLISIIFSGVLLVGLISFQPTETDPITVALLGSAAGALSEDPNAIGALSTEELCEPSLSSVNDLSVTGSFVSGFHESEFVPDFTRLKTFELLDLQPEFRGLAVKGTSPLSWSRATNDFFARLPQGSIVSINAQTAQISKLDPSFGHNIKRQQRNRDYFGSEAGFVIFGPNNEERDLVLVDLESTGKIIKIPIGSASPRYANISCTTIVGLEVICGVAIEMEENVGESPLSKRKTVVQFSRISATKGVVLENLIKTSPNLIMAEYVGQLPNQADIWLGYRGNTRNVFIQSSRNNVVEINSRIGDVNNAYMQPDGSLIVENFSSEFDRYEGLTGPAIPAPYQFELVQKLNRLVAIDGGHQLVLSVKQDT